MTSAAKGWPGVWAASRVYSQHSRFVAMLSYLRPRVPPEAELTLCRAPQTLTGGLYLTPSFLIKLHLQIPLVPPTLELRPQPILIPMPLPRLWLPDFT